MSMFSAAVEKIGNKIGNPFEGISAQKAFGTETRDVAQYKQNPMMGATQNIRFDQRRDTLEGDLGRARSMANVELDPTEQNQMRESQLGLINALQAQAAGTGGPTAAQAQLQQATDQNLRSALAMAASSRGNPALASQAAGRQMSMANQQAAAQSAALRAGEQQAAQGLLGNVLSGARGQDQSFAQAGLEGALAQQAQRNQMEQFYQDQISGNIQGRTQTALQREAMKQKAFETAEALRNAQFVNQQANQQKMAGGILGGLSELGAAAIAG